MVRDWMCWKLLCLNYWLHLNTVIKKWRCRETRNDSHGDHKLFRKYNCNCFEGTWMGDSFSKVRTYNTSRFINSYSTWRSRVGVDAMLHFLTEVSVFVSLPNQCLCQMTGEPLIHLVPFNSGIIDQRPKAQESCAQAKSAMKRKAAGHHRDERPTKRLRTFESVSSVATADGTGTVAQPTLKYVWKLCAGVLRLFSRRVTPADIYLTRMRLFYARPVRAPHQNHIVVGLPPKRTCFSTHSACLIS